MCKACRIAAEPQTWHYGLIAKWWSEFNDDFRPHELPYFRKFIEDDGQPALDVACGSGRLLLPYLRAGLDVDGCDVSADMVAVCREKAEREGLSPNLYVQPMHELDAAAHVPDDLRLRLVRAREHARAGSRGARALPRPPEPGRDAAASTWRSRTRTRAQWKYWLQGERASLPEAARPPRQRRRASDGAEYALSSRIVDLDPLSQHVKLEMHVERWRDDVLEAEEEHVLDICLYFPNELRLMLERAGFSDVVVHGEHTEREPTSADDFLVFVART